MSGVQTSAKIVRVFGTVQCEATSQVLEQLRSLGVEHEFVDLSTHPSANIWAAQQSGGTVKTPVVDLAGSVMVRPSAKILHEALVNEGMVRG